MKKIFKVTQWTGTSFTSDGVVNKTHWFVKALDECLSMLNIGTYEISYVSSNFIKLTTSNYGSIELTYPGGVNTTPYVFYVDTENKTLFGCCSLSNTFTVDISNVTAFSNGNALRGTYVSELSSNSTLSLFGGYFGIKFTEGSIIGGSISRNLQNVYGDTSVNSILNVNCPLLSMDGAHSQPLTAVQIRYAKAPLFNHVKTGNNLMLIWNGDMFDNIYTVEKFYVGAMKTSDNHKFVYGGYLFIVDDARDIGIINTTV